MLAIAADGLAAAPADLRHVLAILADADAALAADLGHVLAIPAHRLTSLLASLARLLGGELVGGALLVGRSPSLAGDQALLLLVHGGEAALIMAIALLHRLAHRRLVVVLVLELPCGRFAVIHIRHEDCPFQFTRPRELLCSLAAFRAGPLCRSK